MFFLNKKKSSEEESLKNKRLKELLYILSSKGFNPEIICNSKYIMGIRYNHYGNKLPVVQSYDEYRIKLNTICVGCDTDKLKIKFNYDLCNIFEYAYLDIPNIYLEDEDAFEIIKNCIIKFPPQDEERAKKDYNAKILNLSIDLSSEPLYSEISYEQIRSLRKSGYWIDTRS